MEIIEPYEGRILDPACGSGGMFVHSAEFVRRHNAAPERAITLHGVEKRASTGRLCRLNLAVHGLSGDIREANTYYDDPHKLVGRFDRVMANPPFNQKEVDQPGCAARPGVVDARFPLGLPTVEQRQLSLDRPVLRGAERARPGRLRDGQLAPATRAAASARCGGG